MSSVVDENLLNNSKQQISLHVRVGLGNCSWGSKVVGFQDLQNMPYYLKLKKANS